MSPEIPATTEQEKPLVWVDEARLKEVALTVLDAYYSHQSLFNPEILGKVIRAPEEPFVRLIKEYGQDINNGDYPLHALFFLTMTLFADNSTNQLNRVAKPQSFRKYAWLFDPYIVSRQTNENIIKSATDYIGASYNKSALPEWRHNAEVIAVNYCGSLRDFFAECDNKAPEILRILTDKKQKKEGFRRFGPKLASLFLLWTVEYHLAELEGIEKIGIPVDFQVVRLAVQTGALKIPDYPVHKGIVTDALIPAFTRLAHTINREEGIWPQDLSKALWFVGHHCCNKHEHSLCPLQGMCDRLISRSPMDDRGLIDPTDVGRFLNRRDVVSKRKREKQIQAGQKILPLF